MKKLLLLFTIAAFFFSCGGSGESTGESSESKSKPKSMMAEDKPSADPKGIGEVKHVDLNTPLLASMVDNGKNIYEVKCAACHKLTDQRVVGPGWAGISDRRAPEWIMNMALNVDVMLEEDPAAREMLKECLVRMPNQNLSEKDARDVLEFMFANDGQEVGS